MSLLSDYKRQFGWRDWRTVFDVLPSLDGQSVLDLGCGVGDLAAEFGKDLDAAAADALGLVTFIPDDIDWQDEVRLAIEDRASFSPDALTGLEASLRFAGAETMETKIFGRLSAWQNWIFQRPSAVGAAGALNLYGTGKRPSYDRKRV